MKEYISKILREELKSRYFLRWTNSPEDDIKRNFSGHMQAWFETKERAYADYQERINKGEYVEREPKYDPISGMWNADPEWGLSGYGFNDEKSYKLALKEIKDIAWHHSDANGQRLWVFKSINYIEGNGFDGEDTFRDAIICGEIDVNTEFNDLPIHS